MNFFSRLFHREASESENDDSREAITAYDQTSKNSVIRIGESMLKTLRKGGLCPVASYQKAQKLHGERVPEVFIICFNAGQGNQALVEISSAEKVTYQYMHDRASMVTGTPHSIAQQILANRREARVPVTP